MYETILISQLTFLKALIQNIYIKKNVSYQFLFFIIQKVGYHEHNTIYIYTI